MRQSLGGGHGHGARLEKASLTIDVAIGGEPFGEGGVVLLLGLVEAGVFQEQHVALVHGGDSTSRRVADAIRGKADGTAKHLGCRPGDRLEREFGRGAILGPAEMGEQDDLGALAGQFGDGRRDTLDASGVGDLAVGDGNVEVDAHQHALAADVADIVQCLEGGHAGSFPRKIAGTIPRANDDARLWPRCGAKF